MKAIQWLSKMMITAVVVSVISVTTTWVMVDMYTGYLLEKLELTQLKPELSLSEVLGYVSGTNDSSDSSDVNDSSEANESNRLNESFESELNEAVPDPLPVDANDNNANQAEEQPPTEEDAMPVWQQKADIVFTPEQFEQTKNGLSEEEKMKIFSILIARVPQEALQDISLWMEDGLSAAEITLIEELMQEHLTADEINELMSILDY